MAVASISPAGRGKALAGDRRAAGRRMAIVLLVLLAVVSVLSLGTGASGTRLWPVLGQLLRGEEIAARDAIILFDIRLPRLALGILVGAALAVSGAVMQGLFRNPLADPGLVGVGAGAGLGAIGAIVLGAMLPLALRDALGYYLVPVAAFLGGWLTTILLYRMSTHRGRTSVAVMLLGGIAIAALAGALSGILIYMANDAELRDLTFWGLGSLAGATWDKVALGGALIVLALVATPFLARALNGLALGEGPAAHLGLPVQKMKNAAILTVAAATGGGGRGVGRHRLHRHRRAASVAPDDRARSPLASAQRGTSGGEPADPCGHDRAERRGAGGASHRDRHGDARRAVLPVDPDAQPQPSGSLTRC